MRTTLLGRALAGRHGQPRLLGPWTLISRPTTPTTIRITKRGHQNDKQQ